MAGTVANAFAAQFQGHQKEDDRRHRPIQPWHINPMLKSIAVRQAEETVAALTPQRRRNPLAGVKIRTRG